MINNRKKKPINFLRQIVSPEIGGGKLIVKEAWNRSSYCWLSGLLLSFWSTAAQVLSQA